MKNFPLLLYDRHTGKRLKYLAIALIICLTIGWWQMIYVPGKSYRGELPPLNKQEAILANELKTHVTMLAETIGERNFVAYSNLVKSANYLKSSFRELGYKVQEQNYQIDGNLYQNLSVEIPGSKTPEEIIVIGGHYDSVNGSPGANDNATGSAGVLVLAKIFKNTIPEKTLRFVLFVNEEPPFFWTENMGSFVYAKRSKELGEKIIGMISLETVGYYSTAKGSQKYPTPLNLLYPSIGDFIGFVGNIPSKNFLDRAIASFRQHTQYPSEGVAAPNLLPGIGWSDHWAFWQHGFPAIMLTDTAPYRYPYYHTPEDTPDKVDYERTARVIWGVSQVIRELAGINSKDSAPAMS